MTTPPHPCADCISEHGDTAAETDPCPDCGREFTWDAWHRHARYVLRYEHKLPVYGCRVALRKVRQEAAALSLSPTTTRRP